MEQIDEDYSSDLETPRGHESKSEFTRPPYTFKGVELFPYTYGYELLFNQVRDIEDTGLFTWMAFVFLLRRQHLQETPKEHQLWACKLAWKVQEFRNALVEWMDSSGPFSQDDKAEARRIYDENMKAAQNSEVSPVISPGSSSTEKKTHRKKLRQSST